MQIKAGRLLGEGGFAFVYEAMDVATGRAVCLKRMIIGSNQSAEDTARKEIRLMQQLSGNPEIVTYFGSSVVEHGSSKDAYIVMEFCQSGHLFGVLQKMASENRLFPPREAARLMAQVAAGLRVLHAQTPPVAHRDIKLENILVTAENACKLCDFGSWSDVEVDTAACSRAELEALDEALAKVEELQVDDLAVAREGDHGARGRLELGAARRRQHPLEQRRRGGFGLDGEGMELRNLENVKTTELQSALCRAERTTRSCPRNQACHPALQTC